MRIFICFGDRTRTGAFFTPDGVQKGQKGIRSTFCTNPRRSVIVNVIVAESQIIVCGGSEISPQKSCKMQRFSHKNSMALGCGDRPQFLFPLENNIHHFDLILLPGLTLHTETNDVTANLKKKVKHPRKGLWASCFSE